MKNRWHILENKHSINSYKKLHPIVQKVLASKGIYDKEDILDFISNKPQRTYDPLLMKNMDEATDIILDAIKGDQRIVIYGDYDVDGLSSVCLMMDLLKNLTNNCSYYIPSRFEEGYGLNKDALQLLKDKGAELVITVDCGSVSVDEVAFAKDIGLDIIITDHHNLRNQIPDCLIINPKQEDCTYPFKEICGCGVAFKIAQTIQRKAKLSKSVLTNLLDLTALATVSDIVPLVDENRVLVKYGLKELNKRKRKGLFKLITATGLKDKRIDAYHIAFILGPHLNAGGRVDTAATGVKLLLSKDESEVNRLSHKLITLNNERKRLQEEGYETCMEIVEKNYLEDLFLVIATEDIHEGVAGIVAGKIKEKYYRPTVILSKSREAEVLKGTGRSIDYIDIYQEMKQFEDLFIKFGGHAGACGFSINLNNVMHLRKGLNLNLQQMRIKHPEYFINEIIITLEIRISDLTDELIESLNQLEPYGYKNERPLFLIRGLLIKSKYFLGEKKNHLKLICQDDKEQILEIIAFNMVDKYKNLEENIERIDLVGFPSINEYNGIRKIQFQVKDFRNSEEKKILEEAY